MSNIALFRTLLAEQGIELTPDQAKKMYKKSKNLIKRAKQMSPSDIWYILEIKAEGISDDEKKQIANLYRIAKEL